MTEDKQGAATAASPDDQRCEVCGRGYSEDLGHLTGERGPAACYRLGYERVRAALRKMVDLADYHVDEIEDIAAQSRGRSDIARAILARDDYEAARILVADEPGTAPQAPSNAADSEAR